MSRILIVDDEKNIRMTASQALSALDAEVDTAVNGEEALQKLEDAEYDVMLLDLRMPGMDGMEVLRRISKSRPEVRVIIITAYGTVDWAVEAMKLGAVDFIQKPFSPKELRNIVGKVLARENIEEEAASDYETYIELAKESINKRQFPAALEHARKAISIDPGRPEGLNLLGVLHEIEGNTTEAMRQYRAANALDPTYQPARENMDRVTSDSRQKGEMRF
ncbi:MAG: response regulator [Candidatus Fermentibacteraceae bacterium]